MIILLIGLFTLTSSLIQYPNYAIRKIQDLDGLWQFAFLTNVTDPTNFNPTSVAFNDYMLVPGAYDAFPRYSSLRGTGVYRVVINQTPGSSSRLHFQACSLYCVIWVDGQRVGDHANGYSPFWQGGIPSSSKTTREIIVVVDNRFDTTRTPLQLESYDFYQYGGLLRSVHFHEIPALSLVNVDILTQDYVKGLVNARVRLHSTASNYPASVTITYSFDDGTTSTQVSSSVSSTGEALFQNLVVPNPSPWSPAKPSLHTITVTLYDGTTISDVIVERFGLRSIANCPSNGKTALCINGVPTKLNGYCRHDFMLTYGSSVPVQQALYDLQLLKDMGGNYLRLVHYPHDPKFLDLCDTLGILVWQENLGWGNSESQLTNAAFVNAQLQGIDEMVYNTFNHPSIILWAFLNEGDSSQAASCDTYNKLATRYRDLGIQGLVTWASDHNQNDVCYSVANPDVISWNSYPGWYGNNNDYDPAVTLSQVRPTIQSEQSWVNTNFPSKAFLKSEIGAGGIPGFSDYFFGPGGFWSVEYQGALLDIVADEVVKNNGIAGVSLWQFCDVRTYNGPRALQRPRSYNNKGTFDEYRRPKNPAYANVRSRWKGNATSTWNY